MGVEGRTEQLDIFKHQGSPQRGDGSGEQPPVEPRHRAPGGSVRTPRTLPLTELPGNTFEDIFRDAA